MIISTINIIVSYSYPASCGMSHWQWDRTRWQTSNLRDCIKMVCFCVIPFPTLTVNSQWQGPHSFISASSLPSRIGPGPEWKLRDYLLK